MTSRERVEQTWNFQEPDRVSFELAITPEARRDPVSSRLNDLIARYADNWGMVGDWGWMGLSYTDNEEVIETRPGDYKRIRCTRHTEAGDFIQITRHPESTTDYHYDKRFVSTLEDLERLTHARRSERPIKPFDRREFGDSFVATIVPHSYGIPAHYIDQIEFYTWLATESTKMHEFFAAQTDIILEDLPRFMAAGYPKYFVHYGLELAIDPWLSPDMLREFVVPYDIEVNRLIHSFGGKVRAHCHGRVMKYFETFAAMGLDGIEPCEPLPPGDVNLQEAKRLVGDRMLLCGNIPSPQFQTMQPAETRRLVQQAIQDAARGGGFILRTTGGEGGTWDSRNLPNVIANCEALVEAALEFGTY